MSDDDLPNDPFEDLDLPQFLEGEDVPLPDGDRWPFGRYFDRNGQPFDVLPDANWWAVAEIVELIRIDPDCFLKATFSWHGMLMTVHTSYLGLNHQWGWGPPLVWETMTESELTGWGGFCARYTTEAAARAGHEKVVEALLASGLVLVGDPT